MNHVKLFDDLDLLITDQSSIIGGIWINEGEYILQDNFLFETIYNDIISHPNPCVIDVGANTGCIGLFNKNLNFPIFAVEPNKLAFQELLNNVWNNRCNTLCYNLAAGDKNEKLSMTEYHTLWGYGFNRISTEQTEYVVDVVTLDNIIPFNEIVSHVKIDVEGYELNVLKGMTRILRQKPTLYLEVVGTHYNRYGYNEYDLFNFLYEFGYEGSQIDQNNYKFI